LRPSSKDATSSSLIPPGVPYSRCEDRELRGCFSDVELSLIWGLVFFSPFLTLRFVTFGAHLPLTYNDLVDFLPNNKWEFSCPLTSGFIGLKAGSISSGTSPLTLFPHPGS